MKGKLEEEIQQRADTLSHVTINTGVVIIAIVGLFMVLSQVGVNIAAALVGLGVIGLAVGFGAQSLIRDLIAGIFILAEDQYGMGDWVDIAGKGGMVEEITLRRTVLRDLDGIVHNVPNGEIRVASNLTKDWARVNINVEVAYGVDLDQAIAIINREGDKIAQAPQWKDDIMSPPQFLGVEELGASGIALKILGETKPLKQWGVMRELRKRIKEAFDEEGIEIPWPHTKVYFGEPLKHYPMIKE
jgi:small conductance mechanosensitive channel